MTMFAHVTPIGVTYSWQLGYASGQRLTRIVINLPEKELRGVGWRRCHQAREEFPVDCAEFVEGYQDQMAGLAHPVSESEEE